MPRPSSPGNAWRRRFAALSHRALIAAHDAGFDVSRETFKSGMVAALHREGVDTVLDVGANTGQFAHDLRRAGYSGRIISLEPLSGPYASLLAATDGDALWTAERAAVSDSTGTVTMHISANSVSSSVLPMSRVHTEAAPQSRYVADEQVPATTVDDLVARYGIDPASCMLKIDVQGYESSVLDGATETLAAFAAIRTEMSLVPLYDGQILFPTLLDRLGAAGFELWFLERGLVQPGTRRVLQVDGTFLRAR